MMTHPPNLSGSASGYNEKMFRNHRSVGRGLKMLGYRVNINEDVDSSLITQFQNDYNLCSKKFEQWGEIGVSGAMDIPTLNGLEHAIRWAKKIENVKGIPAASAWRSFCACFQSHGKRYAAVAEGASEASEPDTATNFIEVLPDGNGKLRNIYNDSALRAEILDFEKHGPIVFAVAILPPQAELPGGRMEPFACPCLIRR